MYRQNGYDSELISFFKYRMIAVRLIGLVDKGEGVFLPLIFAFSRSAAVIVVVINLNIFAPIYLLVKIRLRCGN